MKPVNRSVVIGLIGLGAIVLAVALTFWRDAPEEKSLKEAMQAPATVTKMRRAAENINPPKDVKMSSPTAESTTEKSGAPTPVPIVPSFDVVRVNPEGDAVIAGRAAPGAKITVMDGDSIVGVVTSDRNGEWVLVPEKPLPPGNRALSIIAQLGDAEPVSSGDVVVLAVPEQKGQKERPLAVLVPRKGKDTKRVLQSPRKPEAGRNIALTLDIVDYDEAGRLRLLGQANSGNEAVVYLNNTAIGRVGVSDDGNWELRPHEAVLPGHYTLRVDELAKAKVVARIELPFSRAAPLADLKNEDYIIVQPGNSLWRIARRILGEGTMFSVIYEANKDQIRNADLIYPGQVFAVPKTN
jgi:nucleoid-associated protein YgaU